LAPSCFCALSQQELRGEARRYKEDGPCHKAAWPRWVTSRLLLTHPIATWQDHALGESRLERLRKKPEIFFPWDEN